MDYGLSDDWEWKEPDVPKEFAKMLRDENDRIIREFSKTFEQGLIIIRRESENHLRTTAADITINLLAKWRDGFLAEYARTAENLINLLEQRHQDLDERIQAIEEALRRLPRG